MARGVAFKGLAARDKGRDEECSCSGFKNEAESACRFANMEQNKKKKRNKLVNHVSVLEADNVRSFAATIRSLL